MAISYQQVGAARDTGSQGLMQLGQVLQQESQFQKQLEQAKLEFDTNKKAKEDELKQAQIEYDKQHEETANAIKRERAKGVWENLQKYDFNTISSSPEMKALATSAGKDLGYAGEDGGFGDVASYWNATEEEIKAQKEFDLEERKVSTSEKNAKTNSLNASTRSEELTLAQQNQAYEELTGDVMTTIAINKDNRANEQWELDKAALGKDLEGSLKGVSESITKPELDFMTDIVGQLTSISNGSIIKPNGDRISLDSKDQYKYMGALTDDITEYNKLVDVYGGSKINMTEHYEHRAGHNRYYSYELEPVVIDGSGGNVDGSTEEPIVAITKGGMKLTAKELEIMRQKARYGDKSARTQLDNIKMISEQKTEETPKVDLTQPSPVKNIMTRGLTFGGK